MSVISMIWLSTFILALIHTFVMGDKMSDEDVQKLVECSESLGAKPKLDNPHELQQWMEYYAHSQGCFAETPHVGQEVGLHMSCIPPKYLPFLGKVITKRLPFKRGNMK